MTKDQLKKIGMLNEKVLHSKAIGIELSVKELVRDLGISETTLRKYFYYLGYTPVSEYAHGWKKEKK